MRTFALGLGALMMVGLAAAGCGDDDDGASVDASSSALAATATTTAGAQPSASLAPGAARVKMGKHAWLGDILVDDGGRTLYRFTNDGPNTSNCNGACA